MTDFRNIPPPVEWGIISMQSFDDQAKAADEQSMQIQNLAFGISMPCPYCKTTQNIRFGCRHILGRDINLHEGLTISHSGQYICRSCCKMIEKRKFEFGQEIGVLCKCCCAKTVIDLAARNPELVIDLFSKKS